MKLACGVVAAAAIVAFSALVVAPAGAATGGTISRFAGNGKQGHSGNGGAATAAEFYHPSDEAFSTSGTGYIADMQNCQVRQVVKGVISLFAGVGTCASRGNAGNNPLSGMGGQAAAATIGMPTGVAVDSSGNVFIADCVVYTGSGPGCTEGYILKISASGIISIFAGDARVGNGGSGGAATATSIGAPWGVRTDASGDVFFSDVVYNVIREVNTSGIIKTVAGNGTAGYSGNGGAATSAEINDPTGLYVDGSGNLFIADSKNAVIRKVNTSGVISTFAGTGTAGSTGNGGLATSAELNKPFGIAEDTSGNVYIADYNAYCIREVYADGDIGTYSGTCGTAGVTKEGGSPSSALLEGPSQVVFDPSGNLYVNDYAGEQIDEVAGAE
jgi:trimeric autotransporter adhesin